MREVKDKHAHKGLLALAIGGPSGSQTWIVSLLELVNSLKRRSNESAQIIAFRDHPLPNPSVTRRRRLRRFLLG